MNIFSTGITGFPLDFWAIWTAGITRDRAIGRARITRLSHDDSSKVFYYTDLNPRPPGTLTRHHTCSIPLHHEVFCYLPYIVPHLVTTHLEQHKPVQTVWTVAMSTSTLYPTTTLHNNHNSTTCQSPALTPAMLDLPHRHPNHPPNLVRKPTNMPWQLSKRTPRRKWRKLGRKKVYWRIRIRS